MEWLSTNVGRSRPPRFFIAIFARACPENRAGHTRFPFLIYEGGGQGSAMTINLIVADDERIVISNLMVKEGRFIQKESVLLCVFFQTEDS